MMGVTGVRGRMRRVGMMMMMMSIVIVPVVAENTTFALLDRARSGAPAPKGSNKHLERYCDEVDEVTGAMDAIAATACLEVLLALAPLDTMVATPVFTGVGETPPLSPSPTASAICSGCPFPFPPPAMMFPDTEGNIPAEIVPSFLPSLLPFNRRG